MYAVIFKAKIKKLDTDYYATAKKLQTIALDKYACLEFSSAAEDDQEIAISYWESLEQIQQWKEDPEHKAAQALGKAKWYESYSVQIAEIGKEYRG